MKTYVVTFNTGTGVRKMKVHNCLSELHAGYKLIDYIERKEGVKPKLISCVVDGFGSIFGDVSGFNDIFNGKK